MPGYKRSTISFILLCTIMLLATTAFGVTLPIHVEGLGSLTLTGFKAFSGYILLLFCYLGIQKTLAEALLWIKG